MKYAITNQGICFYEVYELLKLVAPISLNKTVEKTVTYETSKFDEQLYLTNFYLKQTPKTKNKVCLRDIFKVLCEDIDFATKEEVSVIRKMNAIEIKKLDKKLGKIEQNALETMLKNKCII